MNSHRHLVQWTGLSFVFFCIASVEVCCQDFSIKTYTIADGLPSTYIYCIKQDEKGYLWIGTPRGLSRFDGQHFVNYGLEEGLPDAEVDAIYADQEHRLWVGTRRGMAEWKGNRFVTYAHDDSLKVTFVFSFYEPEEGGVWALTRGVYAWTPSGWIKQNLYPGYRDTYCRQILRTDKGLYINYGHIVVLREPNGDFRMISQFHEEPAYYYMNLSQANGVVYISTIEGLHMIVGDSLVKVPGPPGQLKDIFHYFIDSKNRCWVGGDKIGVEVCDLNKTRDFQTVYKFQPEFNIVSGFYEDRQGNIWVADLKGLIKITEKVYSNRSPENDKFPSNRNLFLHQPENELVLNLSNGVLLKWNGKKFQPFVLKCGTTEFNFREYFAFDNYALDQEGQYWYQLRNQDLVREKNTTFYSAKSTYSHLGKKVRDVIFDAYRKSIIVAIDSQRFPCLFDGVRFNQMVLRNQDIIDGQISELHQCPNGTLLFSTNLGTVYSIDTTNFVRQQLDPFHGNGIEARFLNDIREGVWIFFRDYGIERYIWKNDTLVAEERINKNNGFQTDGIWDMSYDSIGNLWVVTVSEIVVLSHASGDSGQYQKKYSISLENLELELYDRNCIVTDTGGNVWIASYDKVVCFDQDEIKELNTPVPTVQIEDVRIKQTETRWGFFADTIAGVFQFSDKLSLPFSNNHLELHYQGISSSGLEGIMYSYQLLPLHTEWSNPSKASNVSFIQLPAGQYEFKVKAQLGNMIWSEPATFAFEIRQPFWETWWFKLLTVLLAGTLIALSFQVRIRQIQNKTKLKEQMRELELIALKSQMNPHFIHNALNSIQSLILNGHSQEASLYISKFARLLRQVLEGGDKKLISMEEELNALRLYIDLERLRMNMEFTYTEEIDDSIFLSQVKIPPVLLQPFVENALWHGLAQKEGEKSIQLRIRDQDDWILCEITDNGIGRKFAAKQKSIFPEGSLSKAVDITSRRLYAFNRISSGDPIAYEDLEVNGQAAGTRVTLRIRKEG